MSLAQLLTNLLAVLTITTHITSEDGPFHVFSNLRSVVDGDKDWSELNYAGKLVNCPVCLAPYISVLVMVASTFKIGRIIIAVMAVSSGGILARYISNAS